MDKLLIGLGIGLIVAIIVYIWQSISKKDIEKASKAEIARLKGLLADRMDLESEGISKLKAENEELKKANENLRVTNSTLAQKPGRAEVQRLQIYQKAVDRLTINSPGFGAAWQSALKESEDEFEKIYSGTQAFWKKILPGRTNAKLIDKDNIIDEQ
jgi:MFS superfamily sulfate permease-like transporter